MDPVREGMKFEDLFCPKCGRLKRKCICKRIDIRRRNLDLLRRVAGDRKDLKPIFHCEDEIVYYRIFRPFKPNPTIPLERARILKPLERSLRNRGIVKLYPFQLEAIELLRKGKNVMITAPTGFGKTEAFVIPMLERIALKGGIGIIFYPTKALAKDQELKLKFYAKSLGLKAVRFDGDSTLGERRDVLKGEADVILTNPDMVDYHLRNTPTFRKIAGNVVFVAVDELHTYSGLLGTNMHYLIKRLERFSDFQIACASATIANAKDFAEEIFEREFVHVHGEQRKSTLHFIMRFTPSIYSSVRNLVGALKGKKMLIFGNSYKVVETIGWILRREGIDVAVHKGGLPKEVRERVEKDFREGRLKVVVATPTLELGIDIGDVDVVISELVSYSQFLQRVGRAGRKGQESIGILLLREEDVISNYYRLKPEDYFKDEQYCYVEKYNDEVMKFQLLSMIMERPLERSELREEWLAVVERLKEMGLVIELDGIFIPTSNASEFFVHFNMRGIGESVRMVKRGKIVGERNLPIAIKELFPGSVIIHNGKRYIVKSIDLKEKVAQLEENPYGTEVTEPLYTSIPRIVRVENVKGSSAYCSLEITIIVYGYVERDVFSREKKGRTRYLDEPVSYTFPTKGFVFSAPMPDPMDYEDFYAGTFHALEHVLIEASDALTGGGSQYMGGISTPEGDIFVYDATIGGSGLSKLLFTRLERAFKIAYDVLKNCECKRVDGCPKCTYSYQCGNNNQPLNRIGAMNVLEKLLKGTWGKLDLEKYEEFAEFKYYP